MRMILSRGIKSLSVSIAFLVAAVLYHSQAVGQPTEEELEIAP